MRALHPGEFPQIAAESPPIDPQAVAEAISGYLIGSLNAKATDVIIAHAPSSHTVTFGFPGQLAGSVNIRSPHSLTLSYIVANMWEYRETADFDSAEELCAFLARLTRLVRRFSHAAFSTLA